ncbi:hypothetical protein CK203_055228 [Vitis vinifera]|uniref:Uncharacterized protein n=1 Tax=Vitis vinifera TaxID=29760 RepID=A0A438GU01_VITVI|nr:hypothetical protein CK203_055228 [Vitis vinifera]
MSDLWSFGWKVGSAICQSLCTFGQGWVCHMFKGGVLCEAAMVSISGVPLAISRLVYLSDYNAAFVPIASLCQVGMMFEGFRLLQLLLPLCHPCKWLNRLWGRIRSRPWGGFVSAPSSTMAAKKDVASSSAARLSRKGGSRQPCSGKPTNKLNKREFRKRFYFPNDISVQLVDGNPMSTEKAAHNAIYFTKEQFNARLRFPLPSLFKEFLHYT